MSSANEITKDGSMFVGYDYKEITTWSNKASMLFDCYRNFGWLPDDPMLILMDNGKGIPVAKRDLLPAGLPGFVSGNGKVKLRIKRDRKIMNKVELTRLQNHFEACMDEIEVLEKSKSKFATTISILIGIIGTAFMVGAMLAITNAPPMILLCILLAIPALIGWTIPFVTYKCLVKKKTIKTTPLIEQKHDEIYEICEKGNRLLGQTQDLFSK